MTLPRVAATGVIVVMAVLVYVLATSESAVTRQADSPLLGKPAPVLDGTGLDGDEVRLDDLRGRWVLINFFATWCVPCRREHPELVRFAQRHEATGDARVISVVFDDDADAVRGYFEEEGGDWPVVRDPEGRIALGYGVSGVPESYLVDPDGYLVAKLIGGVRADDLDELLARSQAAAPAERR